MPRNPRAGRTAPGSPELKQRLRPCLGIATRNKLGHGNLIVSPGNLTLLPRVVVLSSRRQLFEPDGLLSVSGNPKMDNSPSPVSSLLQQQIFLLHSERQKTDQRLIRQRDTEDSSGAFEGDDHSRQSRSRLMGAHPRNIEGPDDTSLNIRTGYSHLFRICRWPLTGDSDDSQGSLFVVKMPISAPFIRACCNGPAGRYSCCLGICPGRPNFLGRPGGGLIGEPPYPPQIVRIYGRWISGMPRQIRNLIR
jgi:hypothetical protein